MSVWECVIPPAIHLVYRALRRTYTVRCKQWDSKLQNPISEHSYEFVASKKPGF